MCQAFSALVTQHDKIYWKAGVDSHEDLRKLYKKDPDLNDDKEPPDNTFARVEYRPKNNDYLNPDTWVYTIDERIVPKWHKPKHRAMTIQAWREWKKQVYTFNVKEARNPIYPFKIKAPKEITEEHIELVRVWASVWTSGVDSVWTSVWDSLGDSVRTSVWDSVGDSVWASVRTSVGASVRTSVGASVWTSVWDSVWTSVWTSVGAYIGSLFPNIEKWKGNYPLTTGK